MEIHHNLMFFYLLVLAYFFACTEGLSRRDYPAGFIFGAGSSAYQEDIAVMKEIGLDSFRFSISWSRVLPKGKLSGGVNREGVEFYNQLINELLYNDIQPFITLFHWDSPQALEDEYGGFLSTNIVNDYRDYADFCFKEFGDRVKYWVTFNEPNTFSSEGYSNGDTAPGRCSSYEGNCTAGDSATEPYVVAHHILLSHALAVKLYRQKYQEDIAVMKEIGLDSFRNDYRDYADFCFKEFGDRVKYWVTFNEPNTFSSEGYSTGDTAPGRCSSYEGNCTAGDSATEPYVVAHHILLSHASAVKLYRQKYQASQMGEIGITVSTYWMVPKYQTVASTEAAARGLDFAFGWFVNPITYGDYPESMRAIVGNRLPNFTEAQSNTLQGSLDFLGFSDVNNSSLPIQVFLSDSMRVKYHRLHLSSLLKTIRAGVDVRGYYLWSFLDDFEWNSGYTYRFGINYVDYKDELRRYMKNSALWFKDFLQEENVTTMPQTIYSQ
ncbi:Beta-glucosidase 29 [Morella rubra]|uniref:Beta-glucosidase 29 n=1 Tax=Morella rubra TaxID=262757 RepID=A0A6A1WJC0_9ROSI|nr:Beta-glucosidase 29 [Morella rubra]